MQSVKLETGETLTFSAEGHFYEIDGKPCPGTHSLMERFGIVKPMNGFTAPYAARGTRVDVMTAYDDEGDLDESSVDSTERGYLEAWRKFKREREVDIVAVQKLVGSSQYWYATTLDRLAVVDDRASAVNVKTGGVYLKPHAIQAHLEWLLYPDAERVVYVYLSPLGTYHLEWYSADEYSEAQKTASVIAQANGMAHSYMTARKKRKETVKA